MKKNKLILFSLYISIIFLLSSCGAPSVALLFSWVHTIDHNAEYFKIDQYGNTAERKFAKNEIDFENDYFSISSSIFCIGEKFKFEFPNKMHEIKGDPYGISLWIDTDSGSSPLWYNQLIYRRPHWTALQSSKAQSQNAFHKNRYII